MTYTLSRAVSVLSAAYGVYALAKPRHLGNALTSSRSEQARYDGLARVYGVRDLTISGLALAGGPSSVRAAMGLRIASDLTDGIYLSTKSEAASRPKVLVVTWGWAALNAGALALDLKRARRRG